MACHGPVHPGEQRHGVIVILTSRVLSQMRAAEDVGRSDPRVNAQCDVGVLDIDCPIGDRFDDFGGIGELPGLREASGPRLLVAGLSSSRSVDHYERTPASLRRRKVDGPWIRIPSSPIATNTGSPLPAASRTSSSPSSRTCVPLPVQRRTVPAIS